MIIRTAMEFRERISVLLKKNFLAPVQVFMEGTAGKTSCYPREGKLTLEETFLKSYPLHKYEVQWLLSGTANTNIFKTRMDLEVL